MGAGANLSALRPFRRSVTEHNTVSPLLLSARGAAQLIALCVLERAERDWKS